jgi:transcriptional regulator with XRE-family HTH domain
MPYHHAPPALRTYRRSWGLSQRELAELLGFGDRTAVSRIEHGKRVPLLQTALACSALFDASLDELFPQLYFDIEEKLHDKVAHLVEDAAQPTTLAAVRKQELFSRALARTHGI